MPKTTIWFSPTAQLDATRAAMVLSKWLTDEERARHDRFLFEKNRHEYLATRALERTVLSAHLGCAPEALRFERNAYGKPSVLGESRIRFNLTNTLDLVACVVTEEGEIGVDAEPLSRADTVLEVATTVFTKEEQADLAALGGEAKKRRAVELWTLKEAYMKAMGMGMSLPPDTFGFSGTTLVAPPPADEDPTRWRFEVLEIEGHLVSVAVERRNTEPVSLRSERISFA